MLRKLPSVVIIGRPNVGKSTLFNRVCGRRRALVGREPGMTRDRLYAPAEFHGKRFEVVDTGGIVPDDRDLIATEIFRQARTAIQKAAAVVLVADAREGVTPLDEELVRLLHRTGKLLTLAVNKVDSLGRVFLAAEFERLGVRDVMPTSAEHGLGVEELLARVTSAFPASARDNEESASAGAPEGKDAARLNVDALPIRVAIIGRPNVGKSTLLNRLINEERAIVTPLPGTTRDAVDAVLERDGRKFLLIDTAGIRRKGKTKLLAEKLSVIQARKHLERADVALIVLDSTEGATALDAHIAGYAHESGRSVILVLNKWDAVAKGSDTLAEYIRALRRRLKYLSYAPIVSVSALKGQHLGKLLTTIVQVALARRRRVATADINRFNKELDLGRAPAPSGKPLRIYYLTQAGVAPPTFVAFTNRPGELHFSVRRFIENRLRERFGFLGTPIIIKTRESR